MKDVTIFKLAMTVTAKHAKALAPFVDDDGKVSSNDVDARTELIPKDDCHAIVGELTVALCPCGADVSLVLANLLIGSYRVKDVVDPEIYINTIAEMFAMFPADIGERIRKDIVGRVKWVPMPAEVKESGDQMVRERNAALYTARRHIEERERRRKYFEDKDRLDADRATREADLEKHYVDLGWEWPGYENASWVAVIAALGAVETE